MNHPVALTPSEASIKDHPYPPTWAVIDRKKILTASILVSSLPREGRIDMVDGKKFWVRPSTRYIWEDITQEFEQRVPILPTNIDKRTHEILWFPTEAMWMSIGEHNQFISAGGLVNPTQKELENVQGTTMLHWTKDFEKEEVYVYAPVVYKLWAKWYYYKTGDILRGFDAWRYCYLGIIQREWWWDITEKVAREMWLYPIIHYSNWQATLWRFRDIEKKNGYILSDTPNNAHYGFTSEDISTGTYDGDLSKLYRWLYSDSAHRLTALWRKKSGQNTHHLLSAMWQALLWSVSHYAQNTDQIYRVEWLGIFSRITSGITHIRGWSSAITVGNHAYMSDKASGHWWTAAVKDDLYRHSIWARASASAVIALAK